MKGIMASDPEMAAKLEGRPEDSREDGKTKQPPVPWRAFLRNRPVQALAYVHFCNNWCHTLPLLSTFTLVVGLSVPQCDLVLIHNHADVLPPPLPLLHTLTCQAVVHFGVLMTHKQL